MIPRPPGAKENTSTLLPLDEYDYIIVSFSGGKDSTACFLHLLDLGVPIDRIELWHQCVDGRPGHDPRFFDWPCTEAYCRAFAAAFGVRLLFQWKEGGFERELLRDKQYTAPTTFELPEGSSGRRALPLFGQPGRTMTVGGHAGKLATRRKFPMPAMGTEVLKKRWCTPYLKIDVARKVFSNDPRFENARAVMLTGERRQESNSMTGGRAMYAEVDEHSLTRTRRVDQWRPVLAWDENEVWEIIRRYRVRPHPAYFLGWGRLSCICCIYGNRDQWASVKDLVPGLFDKLVAYEQEFAADAAVAVAADPEAKRKTASPGAIKMDGYLEQSTFRPVGVKGEPLEPGESHVPDEPALIGLALGEEYPTDLIFVPEGHQWHYPLGAFKKTGGPT